MASSHDIRGEVLTQGDKLFLLFFGTVRDIDSITDDQIQVDRPDGSVATVRNSRVLEKLSEDNLTDLIPRFLLVDANPTTV